MTIVDSSARAGLLTKRLLVVVSHAVERAAMTRSGEPAVVMALFQRLPYFEKEREVYAEIAQRAQATLVGVVERTRPDLPPGVTPILLRPDEELAREWSVVVLTRAFGAFVVAQDLDQVEGQELAPEPGRVFHGRWGFRREEAYAEAARLRDAFGERMPPPVRAAVDAVLGGAHGAPAVEVELRAEAAMRDLAENLVRHQLDSARLHERTEHERGERRDPSTGLYTLDSLRTWLGRTAPGTLPVGLTLVRIEELSRVAEEHGQRIGLHVEHNVAGLLRADLRPVDRAVRLTKNEFLMVQPAVSETTLAETGDRVVKGLRAMRDRPPFVGLSGRISRLVTRERPLPLHRLRAAIAQHANQFAGKISGELTLGADR
ncbi:DICT sensory domain-containing protein [Amycolatopsis anabasis]|uniref:DICT sensory domain-containing protein n=1 Tax=Amycolatopsis anabasis TaxID=1840409 RepID=UPI00131D0A1E|nr:DICT sensory domain-containing protein [Amycolatopsis anabasis]